MYPFHPTLPITRHAVTKTHFYWNRICEQIDICSYLKCKVKIDIIAESQKKTYPIEQYNGDYCISIEINQTKKVRDFQTRHSCWTCCVVVEKYQVVFCVPMFIRKNYTPTDNSKTINKETHWVNFIILLHYLNIH